MSSKWPTIADALLRAGVTLHCDDMSRSALSPLTDRSEEHRAKVVSAIPEDYDTEFLSLDLAVLAVSSMSEAIAHINEHTSKHTNAIITESSQVGDAFCRAIDAAGCFVNASTRFADGFRYGFGTEVGISTGKTHARGPVGLEGLMIYKYVLRSSAAQGHATSEFGGKDGKRYLHQPLSLSERVL